MAGHDKIREAVEPELYLPVEEIARRSGLTPHRIRRLVAEHVVPYRGSQADPFLLAADIPRLANVALGRESHGADDLNKIADVEVAEPHSGRDGGLAPRPSSLFVVNRVIQGDALTELRAMPPDVVQTVVTSPPFWGQRRYADETAVEWADNSRVAFGREDTPEAYVEHTVEVLGQLGRVLRPRGTIWWNIGDSYLTRTILHGASADRIRRYGGERSVWADTPDKRASSGHEYLRDKDITMVPFQVAIAAQRLGLWLRSVIIWSKQSPTTGAGEGIRAHMPEVVTDRPVTGHEYILLFAKEKSYDYHASNLIDANGDSTGPNVRTVWSFKPVDDAALHGARFPDELPRRCILLGSQPGELVLDPFAGYGTTLQVAAGLGREYLGIEISPTYADETRARLATTNLALDGAAKSG